MGIAFPMNWSYGDSLYPLTGINAGGRMIYDPYSNHLMDADDYHYTCLKSISTDSWAWANLESCNDISSQWKPISFSIGQVGDSVKHFVIMEDAKGNILRVPRTGSHWGDPYTVTRDYLSKDTTSSPTSYFGTDSSLRTWKRYSHANYFRQLPSCPAKGYGPKKAMNKIPALTLLPKEFKLNAQWLERLWALSRGEYKEETTAGGMGSCSLIAIAMLQEILEYGSVGQPPLSQSDEGLFFNVGRSVNPVESFRSRHPGLAEELQQEEEVMAASIGATETVEGKMIMFEAKQSLYLSSLVDVGMHYFVGRRAYNPSGGAMWVEHLNVLWADMMALPHNAVSYFQFHGMNSGRLVGHAFVALREHEGSSNGIRLIPTNIADMTLEAFTLQSQRVYSSSQDLFSFLPQSTAPAFTDIRGVMFFQASESSEESADTVNEESVLSSDDACATGASGYGTGVLLPNVSDLNQCDTTDGRCNSDRRSKKRKG